MSKLSIISNRLEIATDRILLLFFLSFYAVSRFLKSVDLELFSFPNRMIGAATLEKVDISIRVGMFTKSVTIFLLVFVLSAFLVQYVFKKLQLPKSAINNYNYLGFAGIIFLLFDLFGSPTESSFSFLIMLLVVMLSTHAFSVMKKCKAIFEIESHFYVLTMVCGFSAYFLIKDFAQFFISTEQYVPLHPFLLAFSWACIFLVVPRLEQQKSLLNKWAYLLRPIAFLPLLSMACDEVYLILNHKGINVMSAQTLYLTGISFLFLIVIYFWKKSASKTSFSELSKSIAYFYLPILIIGLGAFTFYEPFIVARTDLFELGNPSLGIHRFHKFGELPLLESFNSHLLAELFFGFIYTFINGFEGLEYHIYYFLNRVIYGLVCYFFFLKCFKRPYLAAFLVLFMAYLIILVPRSFYSVLLSTFVLHNLFENQRFKDYLLAFFMLFFLIVWRIDIGFANLIATILTMSIFFFAFRKRLETRNLIKAGIYFISGLFLILLSIVWIKDIPLVDNAMKALNYMSSSQTYGYLDLIPEDLPLSDWHYFVFPAGVLLFVLGLISFELKKDANQNGLFMTMAFMFLSIFYLANLQRGIVRHGLVEGTDEVMTSFGFLIIAGAVYYVFKKYTSSVRLMLFVFAAILLMTSFKYNGVAWQESLYHAMGKKIERYRHIQPKAEKYNRITEPEGFAEGAYMDFKAFMNENFSDSATFLDFSNSPMLYFYTNRKVPSYFNQNLLSIHNDYLQDAYIKHLQNYDIPVVVYSSFPKIWFDAVDGVPNSVRHYRIAEYIFKHYSPLALMNNKSIWIRNDIQRRTQLLNSKEIPYSIDKKADLVPNFIIEEPLLPEKRYLIEHHNNSIDTYLELDGEPRSAFYKDLRSRTFIYHIQNLDKEIRNISSVYLPDTINFKNFFKIKEVDYFPDYFSTLIQTFDLKKLPFIWANYDEKKTDKKLQKRLKSAQKITKSGNYYSIPTNIDKSNGNYLELKLAAPELFKCQLEIEYGLDSIPNGRFLMDVEGGEQTYLVRLSTQYAWMANSNNYIKLKIINRPEIRTAQRQKIYQEVNLLAGD